ncbi:hypothetical protein D9619_012337 [Psilocybe cf. subviscida]|uniref:DUF6570 domain-containing protein n=1 Tax=Psilocybe cf. subviscida TaxID=2480587 RepID=A0A8H5ARB2_9AGAR|nr:hypothetical protein D9619_012337 [Psilocybe cf. subviscida]
MEWGCGQTGETLAEGDPLHSAVLALGSHFPFHCPPGADGFCLRNFLMFCVCHAVVHKALLWLKANNCYYQNLAVDKEHLSQLPEDDVPIKIESTVHQCDDDGVVDQESAGYIPLLDNEDVGQPGTSCGPGAITHSRCK